MRIAALIEADEVGGEMKLIFATNDEQVLTAVDGVRRAAAANRGLSTTDLDGHVFSGPWVVLECDE